MILRSVTNTPARAWALVLAFAMMIGTAAFGVLLAAPAQAVQPAQDLVVNEDPVNFTPHVLDGEVRAVAVVGNTVVLGGEFTRAQNAGGGPERPRRNILAFDRTTGVISETFVPNVDDAVRTLAPAADGQSVFVGGKFASVNGSPTYKVAKLNVTTGQKVPGFNPGVVSAIVYDLKLSGDRLFIAGGFTSVAGQPRSMLAELNPTTGALRPSSWPVFAGTRQDGVENPFQYLDPFIQKIDVNPDGQTLMAVGNFLTVGGEAQQQAAMLNITATDNSMTGWRTTQFEAECVSGVESYANDVEYSPDGEYFVIATSGGYGAPNRLCDTVSRWASDRRATNLTPTWAAYNGGDSNYSVAVTGTAIYVGGHQRWWNNPYGNNVAGPGAVEREGIAALDPTTGLPLSWDPGRTRGRGVFDMVATTEGLWVGSDTDRIGNFEYHGRIAYFPLAGGTVVPRPTPPSLPADAYVVGSGGAITAGSFDGDVPGPTRTVVIDGVDPLTITGGFWLAGRLYLAMSDGTMTVRPYDGEVAGPVEAFDLEGFTDFKHDLKRMTGLFYLDGNLVYTLSGDAKLYRRYFTPESNVVGAQRLILGSGGVDWSRSRGMFSADGYIYWADKGASANLHRVTLGAKGPKAGTDTIVSGPTTDGRSWRGRAMFTVPPPPPNQAPTPVLDISCAGFVCTFDASASSDADGQIVDYTWDFGDGQVGSGVQTQHTYAGPGDYGVTLTVTDNDAAVGSTTGTASVVVSDVSFVGSARHTFDTTSAVQSVTLPAGTAAGDQLVMTMSVSTATATVTDPVGWSRVAESTTTAMRTVVWLRTAATDDAGDVVEVALSTATRSALLVGAYRGAVVPAGGVALVGETVSRAAHTTPVLTAVDGSWVLQSWADKTATTTMWDAPDGEVVRETGTQTSTRVSWLLTDSGGPVPAGEVGGETALAQTPTGDSPTGNATMLTVVLAPTP